MRRSMLFVPGNNPKMMTSCGFFGADAIIFDLEDAVSFTPSADVEVSRLGVRTLRIVPKSPLKSDTRYKVALDASKLTGGKAKGVAEFEFSTPKLRFSYNPCWLQQSDDLKYYVLVGETVSSDYAADDYVEQRLKIKGLLKPEVTWTHSEDGTVHKYRVENIPTRSDESYKLTLDFDLDPKRNVEMEVPRKGEYIVLDHTVQTEPLAVVVTFSHGHRCCTQSSVPLPWCTSRSTIATRAKAG